VGFFREADEIMNGTLDRMDGGAARMVPAFPSLQARVLGRALVLGLVIALAAGCGSEKGGSGEEESTVLATVGRYRITRADLERRLATARLPEQARAQFSTPEGKELFLEQLVQEKLLVLAAEAAGVDREPGPQAQLKDMRDQIIASHYSQTVLLPLAEPDSAAVALYYEENVDELYRLPERVRARQIVVATEDHARSIRKRLVAGEPFESLLDQSIDEDTKNLGGALGTVRRGQPVRGLGPNQDFVEAVLEIPAGKISEPIKTTKGYHLVKAEIREPARVRPLAAVSDAIRRRLIPERFNALTQRLVDSLRSEYGVEVDEVALYGDEASSEQEAKQLFEQAQKTKSAVERIRIYEEIAARYGDSKYGEQAQFMIGFIYADELKDRERARTVLREVIERYPNSDLVDSARFLLEDIDSPSPGPSNSGPEPGEQAQSEQQSGGDGSD
jgi:parvulin-like peptidyl-prolyl isomerase